MTTPNLYMFGCVPFELGGYSWAQEAWRVGLCVTEETLWCDAHPKEHPDCATAGCRTEEIRLSLLFLGGRSVYEGVPLFYPCPERHRLQTWVERLHAVKFSEVKTAREEHIACVPPGDKRSYYLPQCEEAAAIERGEFFVARQLVNARTPDVRWRVNGTTL